MKNIHEVSRYEKVDTIWAILHQVKNYGTESEPNLTDVRIGGTYNLITGDFTHPCNRGGEITVHKAGKDIEPQEATIVAVEQQGFNQDTIYHLEIDGNPIVTSAYAVGTALLEPGQKVILPIPQQRQSQDA